MGHWEISLPSGEVEEHQQNEARSRLRAAIDAVPSNVFRDSYLIALDAVAAIGTPWVVQKADIAGTWPKRLATWFRRNQRELLAADTDKHISRCIAELGAKLGPEVNHSKTYLCDLARPPFSWVGRFGDGGSCYRPGGQYAKARVALEDCDARALRFWYATESGELEGSGRCWVVVDWDYGENKPVERVFLFNAYGESLYICARIIATILGMSYHRVKLSNDEMFINNDGMGFVLLPHEQTPKTSYDLGIDVESSHCSNPDCGADEQCGECDNCGELSCECGFCDECNNTRCECECCSHCETYNRCRSCSRCHDCGRELGA